MGSGSGSGSGSERALAMSQYKAASGVLLLGMVQGMTTGWASPAIAKLQSGDGPFVPSLDEVAGISSMFSLGMLAGFVVTAVVSAYTGRRNSLLMAPLCHVAGIYYSATATTAQDLYTYRLLAGVTHSLALGLTFAYTAEIATTVQRSQLALAVTLLMPIGQFIAYTVGPAVSFHVQALLPVPFVIITIILMVSCMPESPFYLATKGREGELLAALLRVRAGLPEEEVRKEAAAIQRTIRDQGKNNTSLRDILSDPITRKAAFMVVIMCSSIAVLGITTVLAFTTQIFQESGTPLSADASSMLLLAINVGMVFLTMGLIERLGRVTLLAMSALGNGAAFASLAGFFCARDVFGVDVSSMQWVPLVSLLSSTASTGLGLIAIPGMLMNELLGQRAKAAVGPVCGLLVAFSAFLINKNFLQVGKAFGYTLPFAFFALTNLMFAVFVLTCVPETKGKSLVEVQDMLRGGSGNKDKKRS